MANAESQLYETVRQKFEQDGVVRDIKCFLQSKLIEMMRGKDHGTPMMKKTNHPQERGDGKNNNGCGEVVNNSNDDEPDDDNRIIYLNQLILEYLHWHGFHYTAETFAMESSTPNVVPVRECLEGVLGKFPEKDIPILLQSVDNLIVKREGPVRVHHKKTK